MKSFVPVTPLLISFFLTSFFSILSHAIDYCPEGHCSKINTEMNTFCISNGMAGKPYLVLGQNGRVCYCPCSCVDANTRILLADMNEIMAKEIDHNTEFHTPLSINSNAKTDHILKSEVEGTKTLEIGFSNGEKLLVSDNHTFITDDELTIKANKLQIGSKVLGVHNDILTVNRKKIISFNGTLFNFLINKESPEIIDHVIVTNGILSGDWQLQVNTDIIETSLSIRKYLLQQ
ncbi:MAG: hypothetical protein HQK53_13350 [Oligoflexia bacterium]|nr:hypothetical protein [Oligoflexia bacterium]